ncbi:MAG: hypothetical protein ACEPOV_09370 [Hyphomicrobiales bacterium]
MKRAYLIVILSVFVNLISAQNLTKKVVLDGQVEIMIPSSFAKMNDAMITQYYELADKPKEAWSNNGGSTNIAFKINPVNVSQISLDDYLKLLKDNFDKGYPKTKDSKGITWKKSMISTINGHQFIHLEMITPNLTDSIYNNMLLGKLHGQLLIITYSCLEKDIDANIEIAQKVISSIKLL